GRPASRTRGAPSTGLRSALLVWWKRWHRSACGRPGGRAMRSLRQLSFLLMLIAGSTIAATVLAAATTAAQPGPLDLTGTWQGKSKCTGFDGAKFTTTHDGETLLIKQTDFTLLLSVNGFDSVGILYPDDKHPDEKGQVGFVGCGN